ncbi:MAG: orotidine-5'-phosphate decarboxylase [Planctomycetaceae bacterium]|nr:orotidine-5'-phosphate decarboxylase [Planctomycetaceae bacterium]
MSKHFTTRLHTAIADKKTPALVGIDPRFHFLPDELQEKAQSSGEDAWTAKARAFAEFGCRLIDVVAPLIPAVKPQAAFFEELGPAGTTALAEVIQYARKAGLIVICDGKRGDIGSTAEAYARAYLAGEEASSTPWGADCLTVNPYLGADTLEPFVKVCLERGAGVYVLVRTSNPGSGEFQDRESNHQKLFEYVAQVVEELALKTSENGWGVVGAVVGATYPEELEQLRTAMPHTPLLVPGYGSQGGTAADVAAAFDSEGFGAVVNSSRGINFAFRSDKYKDQFAPHEWEQAIERATHDMIADLAEHTPAGKLQ